MLFVEIIMESYKFPVRNYGSHCVGKTKTLEFIQNGVNIGPVSIKRMNVLMSISWENNLLSSLLVNCVGVRRENIYIIDESQCLTNYMKNFLKERKYVLAFGLVNDLHWLYENTHCAIFHNNIVHQRLIENVNGLCITGKNYALIAFDFIITKMRIPISYALFEFLRRIEKIWIYQKYEEDLSKYERINHIIRHIYLMMPTESEEWLGKNLNPDAPPPKKNSLLKHLYYNCFLVPPKYSTA